MNHEHCSSVQTVLEFQTCSCWFAGLGNTSCLLSYCLTWSVWPNERTEFQVAWSLMLQAKPTWPWDHYFMMPFIKENQNSKCQIQFFNNQVPYLGSLGFFFISAETVHFPVSRHLGFDSACHTKWASLLPGLPAANPCAGAGAGRPAGWRCAHGWFLPRGFWQLRQR